MDQFLDRHVTNEVANQLNNPQFAQFIKLNHMRSYTNSIVLTRTGKATQPNNVYHQKLPTHVWHDIHRVVMENSNYGWVLILSLCHCNRLSVKWQSDQFLFEKDLKTFQKNVLFQFVMRRLHNKVLLFRLQRMSGTIRVLNICTVFGWAAWAQCQFWIMIVFNLSLEKHKR